MPVVLLVVGPALLILSVSLATRQPQAATPGRYFSRERTAHPRGRRTRLGEPHDH
jgi:hypothetical protein